MSLHTLSRLARLGIIVTGMTAATAALAQGGFSISGRVKVDGGSLDGTKVVVMKDGVKDRVISSNLARFTMDLDINANYVLSFEKDGFVTKKISFDTHAPGEAVANGFTPFEFAVSIFKQYDDVNMVIFNQPVGIIRYDAAVDDFDYDTDYTKSIQSQLQETLDKVAAKQEQEAKTAAEIEKAKAEEARAKAKAEADAAKALAKKAEDEARAKKEQEAAAAKAAAEKTKQEGAAAKAEQERLAAEARKAEEAKRAQAAADKTEQERLAQEARKAEEEKKKAELAKAEEDRKAALAKKEEEKRKPPPPPVAVVEKPRRPGPEPRVENNSSRAGVLEGEDARRSIGATEGYEESRMQNAPTGTMDEAPPVVEVPEASITRNEELIVEANQVITVIRLETDKDKIEFRKVVHKYGAVFYFKNGKAISKELYENEALATAGN